MMVKQYEQKTVSTKNKNKIRVDSDKHSEKARGKSNNNNSCRQPLLHGPRAFSQCLTKKKSPHDDEQQVFLFYQLKKILLCAEGDLQNLALQKSVGLQQTDIDIEMGHWQEIKRALESLLTSKLQQANAMKLLSGGCDE